MKLIIGVILRRILTVCYIVIRATSSLQGDHLSGKPGNVREFDRCQGNVRDFTKIQGNVGKSCQGKVA